MKIAPFVVVLLAIGFATYTQAAPEPLFGLIETAANIIGAGISAIAGAIEGFINGALGGVLTGVLKSGNFASIPNEGGCQAENVAKIIDNLFKVLEIPVVIKSRLPQYWNWRLWLSSRNPKCTEDLSTNFFVGLSNDLLVC
ncbi:hypothetical protein Anas_14438 [Armadillidium nasatum]|uniref:Uncharacterized protein n=1 Tax=Armadillidium nasatum TaxID=96803 RepID=A0A5N5T0Y7_9CRUS|nr:hypothetical protein Anas_14438 [Armadillidium nasatum]